MSELTEFRTAREAAQTVLALIAERPVLKVANDLYASGRAAWRWDPEVRNVVGLVKVDQPAQAWMVIYLKEMDFELDADFERLLDAITPGWYDDEHDR